MAYFCIFSSSKYSWQYIGNIRMCQWLDSNRGPLVAEASALPTEPQTTDHNLLHVNKCIFSVLSETIFCQPNEGIIFVTYRLYWVSGTSLDKNGIKTLVLWLGSDVINKSLFSITMLRWNKALWLVKWSQSDFKQPIREVYSE